jgi:ankyrin repeat protein
MVQLLLNHGALVSEKDAFGRTPLHLAAASGNEEIVKLLLDTLSKIADNPGLDVMDIKLRTPLHEAAFNGAFKVVKLLADSGATATMFDYRAKTPASLAENSDYQEIVAFLRGREHLEKERKAAGLRHGDSTLTRNPSDGKRISFRVTAPGSLNREVSLSTT